LGAAYCGYLPITSHQGVCFEHAVCKLLLFDDSHVGYVHANAWIFDGRFFQACTFEFWVETLSYSFLVRVEPL